MTDTNEDRNLDISCILGSSILWLRALTLVVSLLIGAALGFLAPTKAYAHTGEGEGCCQLEGSCRQASINPGQEECEVDGGTFTMGQMCQNNRCNGNGAVKECEDRARVAALERLAACVLENDDCKARQQAFCDTSFKACLRQSDETEEAEKRACRGN